MSRLPALAVALLACAAPSAARAGDECATCRDLVIDPPNSPVVVERHFTVDAGSGSVVFGDGVRGAVPPTGTHIDATYRTGTGGGTTISKVGAGLSASVVTLKPALVALPPAADDDKDDDEDEPQ